MDYYNQDEIKRKSRKRIFALCLIIIVLLVVGIVLEIVNLVR